MKKILGISALVMLLVLVGVTYAAPLATTYGPAPLYDSGWIRPTKGDPTRPYVQEFAHNLGAMPTSWTVLVADTAEGNYPTAANPQFIFAARHDNRPASGGLQFPTEPDVGYQVVGIRCNVMYVMWGGCLGYDVEGGYYHVDGDDYVRLLIWSADDNLGNPSCR